MGTMRGEQPWEKRQTLFLIEFSFQNFCLHTNQAGIFVVVVNVVEFVDLWIQKLKFFISFEVKSENVTAKMTMDAGEIKVDASTICGSESEISNGKLEIYKDLLAVTSASTMVQMTVNFEKPSKLKFHEFMNTTLKFAQLTADEAEIQNVSRHEKCLLYYCYQFF
jgi:hypothetical protein